MKLLALRLCAHDSSFCYFNGHELKYLKTERAKGIKHHAYNNLSDWQHDFTSLFNEDISTIDQIGIVVDSPSTSIATSNVVLYNELELPCKTWRINHHYAHALSVWMLTDKKPDISIVMDGFGDLDHCWTVFQGDTVIDRGTVGVNGSLGMETAQAGRYLGIGAQHYIDIPGKLMGLQSYGTISNSFIQSLDKHSIHDIHKLFSFSNWVQHIGDETLARLLPLDWIRSLHHRTGELLVSFFKQYATLDQSVSFTGGVAQNVLWNTELRKHFKNIIIPPHSTDDGLTLGIMEWLRIHNNLPPFKLDNFPFIQHDEAPQEEPTSDTIKKTAHLLSQGYSVGWYQGHGEMGPRALGNRSVLLDPRIKNGRTLINNIKKRENYRPFGASVLHEYKDSFFEINNDNFMLFVAKVKTATLQSITHVDGTCRVQTVDRNAPNKAFRQLLEEFYKLTKCPVLLNTSLNLAGKPLAGTIDDAKKFLNSTPLDYLVVGNEVLKKL